MRTGYMVPIQTWMTYSEELVHGEFAAYSIHKHVPGILTCLLLLFYITFFPVYFPESASAAVLLHPSPPIPTYMRFHYPCMQYSLPLLQIPQTTSPPPHLPINTSTYLLPHTMYDLTPELLST